MADKKVGRPTDNPKSKSIHVRLDSESEKVLNGYCERNKVTMAEAIRNGIKLLGVSKKEIAD